MSYIVSISSSAAVLEVNPMTTRHNNDDKEFDDELPRANRGRHTPADDLRNDDLRRALTQYGDAYLARGAGEANMVRGLAAGYEIAMERARATSRGTAASGQHFDDKVFAWHFASILGEFAVGSHDSERSLYQRGNDAYRLVNEFPHWVTAIELGRVDMRHAQALLKHSRVLEPQHLLEYGQAVLEFAQTHTPGQTHRHAETLAATIASEAFDAAHERARKERHVTIKHDGLGMAMLYAYLPSEIAAPIEQLLDKGARELRALDRDASQTQSEHMPDTRTLAQMRADVFAETLLCATPGASRVSAVVSITIPALSLVDQNDGAAPALLDGMMPMSATEAKHLAAGVSSLQRILTHPVTGQVTAVDTYQPDRALRRFLHIRDRTCRHPGCVRPATRSEIDHTTPFSEGGKTNTKNLACLCLAHHTQKHEKPWTVTNLGDGVLEWRTPLGQIVRTEPEPVGPIFKPTENSAPGLKTGPISKMERYFPPRQEGEVPNCEDDPPPF